MATKRSKPIEAAEIIPPETKDQAADREAGLRMPPLIDLAQPRLRDWLHRLTGWARGTAYQITLLALVVMAVGLLGLAILEVGRFPTPDWQALWARVKTQTTPAPQNDASQTNRPQNGGPLTDGLMAGDEMTSTAQNGVRENSRENAALGPQANNGALINGGIQAEADPADRVERDVAAGDKKPELRDAPSPPADRAQPELLADVRQTLADTRRDLSEAKAALLAQARQSRSDNDMAAPDGDALARLTQKAVYADLLLRLDYGLPFDDVLDAGQLETVLNPRELAVLALHAVSGLPTEAAIRAQADTLPLILSGPDGVQAEIPRPLQWLAERAPNLVNLRRTPMAGAGEELHTLYRHLQAKDYGAAAGMAGRLVERTKTEPAYGPKLSAALQALYADLRAFDETRNVVADLRNDYLAGVRP